MNTDNANKYLNERQIYQRDVWDSKDIEHPLDCLLEDYHQEQLKLLSIADVSGSLLSYLDYWKQRCELAEKCIEESPCDPDITSDQIKAHNAYNKFISNYGNDR